MMNDQTLVLMSIVYQMLEKDPNIDGFNPFVQEYLEGLAEELNEMTEEEQNHVYFYADTFFNKINNVKEVLH